MRYLGGVLAAVALSACPAAHAALPSGFVGLYADDSFFGDSAYRSRQMAAQAWLGVQVVRQPFEWSRVERRRGVFDFRDYDPYMADAARAGIRVLPFLVSPPPGRSRRPPGSRSRAMYPPRSNAAFARFAAATVRRYGTEGSFWKANPELPFIPIRSWQVWNEPNIPNWWRSGPSAREYVALLRTTARAIRGADPRAEVVSAGLPHSRLGIPFHRYLDQMYRAGARPHFDTLAMHAYSRDVRGLLQLVEDARSTMDRHGDRSRLWVTEFGWSTAGDASAFRVSEAGQADRISMALSGLIAERRALRLRGLVLFKWRDAVAPPGLGSDPWPLHAGLLRPNGAPKPGLFRFGRIVADSRAAGPLPPGDPVPVSIPDRSVRVSPRGVARLRVGCSSAEPGACGGVLRLTGPPPKRCGRLRPFGSARFRISVAPAIVPVRLSAAARRVLRCAGTVRARATAVSASGDRAGRSVELTLRAR